MLSKLPKKIDISDQILFQEIEGESVLLDLETEKYYGLDETGTRIWHLLSNNENAENVLNILQNEYAVDAETLHDDLLSILNDFQSNGLIKITER